jgi:hypothetical protein
MTFFVDDVPLNGVLVPEPQFLGGNWPVDSLNGWFM